MFCQTLSVVFVLFFLGGPHDAVVSHQGGIEMGGAAPADRCVTNGVYSRDKQTPFAFGHDTGAGVIVFPVNSRAQSDRAFIVFIAFFAVVKQVFRFQTGHCCSCVNLSSHRRAWLVQLRDHAFGWQAFDVGASC